MQTKFFGFFYPNGGKLGVEDVEHRYGSCFESNVYGFESIFSSRIIKTARIESSRLEEVSNLVF